MIRLAPILIAVCILMIGLPANAAIWQETGDAGNRFDPQTVYGTGPLEGISGMIGGDDMVDAFEFYFDGTGLLSIIATFDDFAPAFDESPNGDEVLYLKLFSLFDSQLTLVAGPEPITLAEELSVAGNYVIEVATSMKMDPPFSIGMAGPLPGSVQFIPRSTVPEPTSIAVWSLLAMGLLVWRRRR